MTDLDKSKGGSNKYFMWCDEMEQKRAYGSCLCVKDAYEAGRLPAEDAGNSCSQAMARGNCVAVTMRNEEIAAGKSLYFTEGRPKLERLGSTGDMSGDENYQRGWMQVGRALGKDEQPLLRKPQPAMKMRKSDNDLNLGGDMDMGKLITRELQKEKDKSLITKQLIELKREIIAVAKSQPARARTLMIQAKKLQESIA